MKQKIYQKVLEERLKVILWKRARETHPERPVSENWPEYEKIDGKPEK